MSDADEPCGSEQHSAQSEAPRSMASGAQRASAFTIYGERLESVATFKYLGRLLAMDNNDMPAVRANILKSRKVWKRLGTLLRQNQKALWLDFLCYPIG